MQSVTQLVCVRPSNPATLDIRTAKGRSPAAGDVLVEVEAASVNPIDLKRAGGYGQRLLALKGAGRFPLILGNDFAGEVVAVGDGVLTWRPGDRVMGLLPTGKAGGAHRSHLTVAASQVRPLPGGVSFAAAVLPYTFTTLWQALAGAGLSETSAPGRRVLVHGASGGLGRLALHLLGRWGARVTAICGPANVDLCRGLGAETVVDRTQNRLEDLPADFDASLNFAAWEDEAALLDRLRPQALGHATTVHPLLATTDRLGLLRGGWRCRQDWRAMRRRAAVKRAAYRWVVFQPDAAALDALHHQMTAGGLALPVGLAVPFSQAGAAFAHVAAGRPGRAVLLPGA